MKPPSGPKKQTQFKPNQTQFPESPNECKLNYKKGLQKKWWFFSPNKQTQFRLRPKMNVSLFISKDYRKIDDFASQKNKPNFKQALFAAKIGNFLTKKTS